jgi:large subunit ribosomal protein L17
MEFGIWQREKRREEGQLFTGHRQETRRCGIGRGRGYWERNRVTEGTTTHHTTHHNMTLGRNAKMLKHTLRNLVSSLIQHEHVTTTPAKAKLAADYVENLIVKSKKHAANGNEAALKEWRHLLYGKLYNQRDTVGKVSEEFVQRYANRDHGFTRMLKLEPRYGDNAPQVALEMVDNESRELFYWYVAKVVARLELQGIEVDSLTQKNVDKVTKYKADGAVKFREVVDICKKTFFANGVDDADAKEVLEETESVVETTDLKNKPRFKSDSNGFNKQFKNFKVVPRE